MESTKLLYLENMDILETDAVIMDVLEEEGKQVVILNQTIFYPQGGGQPYDQGEITSEKSKFIVEQVRFIDGVVKHIGMFKSGNFKKSDKVTLSVNPERRLLNSKLHSAGHLVDVGIYALKPDWIADKGFHFPDGPYVEYKGEIDENEKENFKQKLEKECNEIIQMNLVVSVVICEKNDLSKYCRHVPENIPEGKPIRIVLFNDFGVPCGGTHVSSLSEIKSMSIRKIKVEKGTIRISYDVEK